MSVSKKKKFFYFSFITLCLAGYLHSAMAGQEFRSFQAIPTPGDQPQAAADLSSLGYQRVASAQNLPIDLVEKVVYELFDSWNSPKLNKKLAQDFPNKSRIMDAIQAAVPRYVQLQILSIQNPRIVEQYLRPHPSGDGSYQVLSKVSVRVTSQVAASTGVLKNFRRSEGTSEYLISITQKVHVA